MSALPPKWPLGSTRPLKGLVNSLNFHKNAKKALLWHSEVELWQHCESADEQARRKGRTPVSRSFQPNVTSGSQDAPGSRAQRYGAGRPRRALKALEFWWANRAGARYYDYDLRELSRGIFQQT